MKKFFDFLFSMQFSGALLLIFAAAIGTATFVENDLGTLAARLIVYEAFWFEFLMGLMAFSMIGGVFKYRLYQRKKFSVLLFHLSFVIILIGAAVTRYAGYEGTMMIRENSSSNQLISEKSYITVNIQKDKQDYYFEQRKLFSPYKSNHFEKDILFGEDKCNLSLVDFIPNAAETIEEAPNGNPIISFVTVGMGGQRENVFLKQGEIKQIGQYILAFDAENTSDEYVQISSKENNQLEVKAPFEIGLTSMADGNTTFLEANKAHPFGVMKLYKFGSKQFVIKAYYQKAKTKLVSVPAEKDKRYSSAVVMNLTYKGTSKEIVLYGGKGFIGEEVNETINNVNFKINYGSKYIDVPFSLYLRDFQLERYPGSMSPSSFASEVTVIDDRINLKKDHRIFMNNVLNYDGYRFFQSSYDKDEKGTVLSVNHDYWGTLVTYIGYFLMGLGMIINFFHKDSRFRNLMRATSKKAAATIIILLISIFGLSNESKAQTRKVATIDANNYINAEHAKEFGELLVLDPKGRVEPINTLSSEIVRKVTKKATFMGLTPDQIFLGMLSDPGTWQSIPMIKVSDRELKKMLGISGNYATFNDFLDFSKGGSYKLSSHVDAAYKKKPSMRDGFDKEVIKVDERVNITYMVFKGDFLKIFPKRDDPNNSWYTPNDVIKFDSADANFIKNIIPVYFGSIKNSIKSKNWVEPTQNLSYIRTFQNTFGKNIIPPKFKTDLEIIYNNVNIFKRLFPYYALIGFIMLMLQFVSILKPKYKFKRINQIGIVFIILAFTLQTFGLVARWYISGHAPWSNGFESMIYIAWATVLAGLFFTRKSMITVATTTILASLTLMVSHMSWMDPEITTLVPVLKSYWLIIHVAVITASYSFLAIGALLGFFNLILMNLKNPNNKNRLEDTIKELTNINEMNLIIGGFLLTIGTFLGAVWANESWGRYWGWDPKETWALVTIVIYAFIVHMRLTPGLKGTYAFNFAALISFSSVLMTYFGVNYYLSGMHSYAKGDPVPVPTFVYYTIIVIAVVSFMAYRNEKKMKKS